MIDLAVLLVADRQHRHLDRDDTALTVVLQHFVADVLRRHQLAHEAVVVDVDIVDQAVDLV